VAFLRRACPKARSMRNGRQVQERWPRGGLEVGASVVRPGRAGPHLPVILLGGIRTDLQTSRRGFNKLRLGRCEFTHRH
jgi:hypothetical protein